MSLNEVKVPKLPWKMIEEGIRKLKEVGILKWLYYVEAKNPPEDYNP